MLSHPAASRSNSDTLILSLSIVYLGVRLDEGLPSGAESEGGLMIGNRWKSTNTKDDKTDSDAMYSALY